MKLKNLFFSLRSIVLPGMIAALVCFSATFASAQGGSGRITPTTGAAKKKTTTVKKAVTTVAKKTTTTSRNVKKPVTTAKNFNYYYNRGQTFYDQGDLPSAILNYTQALKLNPASADAYYNRGLAYYDNEEFYKAISDYSLSIRFKPQADAYNNRGLAYEGAGNDTAALADYRMALRLNPQYDLARQNLDRMEGNSEEDGGDEGRAGSGNKNVKTTTTTTNTNTTKDADYYATLADEYYEDRDFDNALINYTKAINLAPREAGSYVRRGFIYHYTGEVVKAYDDYETAVSLDPALKTEAYIKCMLYSVTTQNASSVITDCTKTINEFPAFSLAFYKRGVAYRELNNLDSSMRDFNKSVELYPKFFNSIIYRGMIYAAWKNNASAISEYTSAINMVGANSSKAYLAYNNRGTVYEGMGNYTQAAADYRKSYQLNPSFTTAKENLDSVLQKQRGNY